MNALRMQNINRTSSVPAARGSSRPVLKTRDDSSVSSRAGSGDSAQAAGRILIGGAPSQARNNTTSPAQEDRAEGLALSPDHLLQLLDPTGAPETFLQLSPDMQAELLATAMQALTTRGTGEAMQTFSAAVERAHNPKCIQNPWHGLLGNDTAWPAPRVVAQSSEKARPGYDAGDASEYLDCPEVLRSKAKLLAQMWGRSGRNTVLYTGAGLSTASGIGDYASKASKSVAPHKKQISTGSRLELNPTLAHHALAALEEKGLIGNWVQQNHDRLAQKAGFPQARINEIHGAWGDMKNQVKMMDDSLRQDLLAWLCAWAERADMCVALGTSLCGMNADQVPRAVAERFAQSAGEGLVIIGLQRTVYDDVASLRIWGLCDDVMSLVAKELGCQVPCTKVAQRGQAWISKHPRLSYNTRTRSSKDPL